MDTKSKQLTLEAELAAIQAKADNEKAKKIAGATADFSKDVAALETAFNALPDVVKLALNPSDTLTKLNSIVAKITAKSTKKAVGKKHIPDEKYINFLSTEKSIKEIAEEFARTPVGVSERLKTLKQKGLIIPGKKDGTWIAK